MVLELLELWTESLRRSVQVMEDPENVEEDVVEEDLQATLRQGLFQLQS